MSPIWSFLFGVIVIPSLVWAGEESRLPKNLLDACDRRPKNVEKLESHFKGSKPSISSCVEAQRKAVSTCNQEPESVPGANPPKDDDKSREAYGANQAALKLKDGLTKARDAHLGRTEVCQRAKQEAKQACDQNFDEVSTKQQEASQRHDALQKEFFDRQQQGQFDPDLHKRLLESMREKSELDEGRKMIRNSRDFFESGMRDGEICQVSQARIYQDAVTQSDMVATSASADGRFGAGVENIATKASEKARDEAIQRTADKTEEAIERTVEKNVKSIAKGVGPAAGIGLASDPLDVTLSVGEEAAKLVVRAPLATGVGTFASAVMSPSPLSSCDQPFSPLGAYRNNCQYVFTSQSISSSDVNERAIQILESP